MLESNSSICPPFHFCLLYTSDAADERSSVDLGGRRIIKKKTKTYNWDWNIIDKENGKWISEIEEWHKNTDM